MKIEILFKEACNLYGDIGNITYLKSCLPKAKFIETSLNDEPAFIKEKVDLIYMSSMTEKNQELIIKKLLPYKNKIKELIDNGTIFLLVGNSFEMFLNYIETEDNKKIEGLRLLNFYAKRSFSKRFNSLFVGSFNKIKIVGYTSRFTHTYGDNSKNYLFKVDKGLGLNENSIYEGIRVNNLFATYMLGPLLISNPLFTKYIISLLGSKNEIAFKKDVMTAYKVRLEEYQKDIELH